MIRKRKQKNDRPDTCRSRELIKNAQRSFHLNIGEGHRFGVQCPFAVEYMAVQQLVYGSQRCCEYFGALVRRYVDHRRTYHSIRIYSTILLWCAPHADFQYSLWFFFRLSSQNAIALMYEGQPVIGSAHAQHRERRRRI